MATPEAREFAALLKELKDRSGRSYGVLAGRLHVSTSTLHRYCNGDAVPNEYAPVERLARLCGAGPDEMVELHRRWILADAARRRPTATEPGAQPVPAPGPAAEAAPEPASVPDPDPDPDPDPESVPGPESAPDPEPAVVGAKPVPPRRKGLLASRRSRVLLAAAAVVALTVPTSIVVSRLTADRSDEFSNAPSVQAKDADEPELTGGGTASASPDRPKKSGSASPSGRAGASSSATPGAPTASPGRGGGGKASGGVPLTATISSYNWDDPCDQFYVLDQDPDDVPPPPPSQERRNWARALGGVDGGRMKLEITVQGKSGQAVVLNRMHVRTLSRKAPLPWSAYSMGEGCGSGVTPQTFDIDLDDNRPTLTPVAGQRNDKPVPPKDFPFQVSSTDVEVFDLDAHVEGHDVSWYLELEWNSGGRKGTLRIDDNGKPFRTSSTKTRPMYIYWYDSAQWKPPVIPIE
ncbi:helix-turn-helix domain-containing protein [Streptomyces sp. NPDC057496]|uniref:helix-turn-helix domain-containing protein n=1 Tax=Streptomyces sp. NPDC057496 TaxID=3346149 RepID=UPI00367BBCEE